MLIANQPDSIYDLIILNQELIADLWWQASDWDSKRKQADWLENN